jgi:gliding motility-associated-like protein
MSIKPVPEVVISPADTSIFYNNPVKLVPSINGNYSSFSWAKEDGLTNPALLTNVVTPTKNSTYRLNVFTADGCNTSASAKVFIMVKVLLPNAFSPNGDGKNDVFRIPPSISFQLKKFVIFDRWGNEIFTTVDIKKGWDGRYKGQLCDNGSYVYVIEGMNNSERISLRGSVVLVR